MQSILRCLGTWIGKEIESSLGGCWIREQKVLERILVFIDDWVKLGIVNHFTDWRSENFFLFFISRDLRMEESKSRVRKKIDKVDSLELPSCADRRPLLQYWHMFRRTLWEHRHRAESGRPVSVQQQMLDSFRHSSPRRLSWSVWTAAVEDSFESQLKILRAERRRKSLINHCQTHMSTQLNLLINTYSYKSFLARSPRRYFRWLIDIRYRHSAFDHSSELSVAFFCTQTRTLPERKLIETSPRGTASRGSETLRSSRNDEHNWMKLHMNTQIKRMNWPMT